MAYYLLEPRGDLRRDIHTALITSMIANANRDKKIHPSPFPARDFLPKFDRPVDEEQSPEEQIAIAAQITHASGGRDLRTH